MNKDCGRCKGTGRMKKPYKDIFGGRHDTQMCDKCYGSGRNPDYREKRCEYSGGCWEMLGSYLVASDIPLAVIARRLYDPRLEKELYHSRSHAGLRVISRGKNTRDIIRILKKGYFLGILIDQDIKVKGTFVDFFGHPAYTATAPAYLALRYKLPIIPFFTYRDEYHRHHACVGPPISIEETGDSNRDVEKLTAWCSQTIEKFIRQHPEQWIWFHRRWKTKPK